MQRSSCFYMSLWKSLTTNTYSMFVFLIKISVPVGEYTSQALSRRQKVIENPTTDNCHQNLSMEMPIQWQRWNCNFF